MSLIVSSLNDSACFLRYWRSGIGFDSWFAKLSRYSLAARTMSLHFFGVSSTLPAKKRQHAAVI
ncbi:hypothetical protein BpHYR1_028291 [Brachionus plicatilis]|uniref:Uncharacterized protein n=1 Tax=Brachionus plicatilis TaxID=10195 RepID=A0A3M7R952_BRAPC|nr:hypothetical protein BpHYR1_028291 [Brachionus plicatilis]